MFTWSRELLDSMEREALAGGKYQALAELVLGTGEYDSVCDAGAGAGFLAEQLAVSRRCVAVESDPLAYSYLKRRKGVETVCADIHKWCSDKRFSALVCCNFGSVLESLLLLSRLAETLVMVRKDFSAHRFSGNRKAMESDAVKTCSILSSLKIPYRVETESHTSYLLFHTLGEAESFFGGFGTSLTPSLLEPAEGAFSFRYPYREQYAAIKVRRSDIPDMGRVRNILLTGERGAGKSTIVKRCIPSGPGCGFLTRKEGESLLLEEFATGKSHPVARLRTPFEGEFDRWGVKALEGAAPFRVMDELGFLERDERVFQNRVLECMADGIPTLGVVRLCEDSFLKRVKETPGTLLFHVERGNREYIAGELERSLPVLFPTVW